jgi:hypothetical protein
MKAKANSIGGSRIAENQPAESDEKVSKEGDAGLPVFKILANAEIIPDDRARQLLEECP